jgi:hypothetical protein
MEGRASAHPAGRVCLALHRFLFLALFHNTPKQPKESLIHFYAVIPSGAELPLFGNSAQSKDLAFLLQYLIRVFRNRLTATFG